MGNYWQPLECVVGLGLCFLKVVQSGNTLVFWHKAGAGWVLGTLFLLGFDLCFCFFLLFVSIEIGWDLAKVLV
jgi:hypothetical protein